MNCVRVVYTSKHTKEREANAMKYPECDHIVDGPAFNGKCYPCHNESMNRDYYCKHGTYVGDPYGPDYMCGMCEDVDF